ncbi:MAG: type II toxin-antitoxin system RelE/ParE family toxin [Alphaproteobacteria bacterium]
MNTILQTVAFKDWLSGLKDAKGKAAILVRIKCAQLGNLGKCEPVGKGVTEMKINSGPGYRVYFVKRGSKIYLLLCGGDKKTQSKDIERAHAMRDAL